VATRSALECYRCVCTIAVERGVERDFVFRANVKGLVFVRQVVCIWRVNHEAHQLSGLLRQQ
jgi:hypothetical protein